MYRVAWVSSQLLLRPGAQGGGLPDPHHSLRILGKLRHGANKAHDLGGDWLHEVLGASGSAACRWKPFRFLPTDSKGSLSGQRAGGLCSLSRVGLLTVEGLRPQGAGGPWRQARWESRDRGCSGPCAPRERSGVSPAGGGSVPPPPSGSPRSAAAVESVVLSVADRGLGRQRSDRLSRDIPGSWLCLGARVGPPGSPPRRGAPQRRAWVAWQVWPPLAMLPPVVFLPAGPEGLGDSALSPGSSSPCLVAQGQPGGGTGGPSGGHPTHRGCRKAGAGLAPGPGCLWALWVGAEPS